MEDRTLIPFTIYCVVVFMFIMLQHYANMPRKQALAVSMVITAAFSLILLVK